MSKQSTHRASDAFCDQPEAEGRIQFASPNVVAAGYQSELVVERSLRLLQVSWVDFEQLVGWPRQGPLPHRSWLLANAAQSDSSWIEKGCQIIRVVDLFFAKGRFRGNSKSNLGARAIHIIENKKEFKDKVKLSLILPSFLFERQKQLFPAHDGGRSERTDKCSSHETLFLERWVRARD